MKFRDVHLHFHFHPAPDIGAQLQEILMNQAQLAAALGTVASSLTAVGQQLDKATQEIVTAVQNAGNTSPEVDAALEQLTAVSTALSAAAQGLDDLNPDAPAPAPAEPA